MKKSGDVMRDLSGSHVAAMCTAYGAIQAVLSIPVLYGYAAIIFSHPVYHDYMPSLAKLMLVSCVVHGLSFCVGSSMTFAIGQVQDVGLIFLSKIATDIANRMEGEEPARIVSTALTIIALGTAVLGLLLVVIGKAKLANMVSYLPMPVIGGYLAFIGYFCLEAGLSLSTGKQLNGLKTWGELLSSDRAIILCTPGMVAGGLLTYVSRTCKHFGALPLAIIIIPIIFYVLLMVSGTEISAAREYGWVGPLSTPADITQVFSLYDLTNIEWSVLPYQLPVWAAMVVVVAFSSCLDIAAIEMDMGSSLDTNAELQTVGWSNFFSGICGGFTGSYIFSQTIFGLRSGFLSRYVSGVMILLEAAVVLVTIDPLSYVPLYFFAATLIFIAVDLMVEWLWDVRKKLSAREYAILLITFAGINIIGLDPGLLLGICCSLVNFVFTYATYANQIGTELVTKRSKRSKTLRHPTKERHLRTLRPAIVTLELHGAVFFGSSVAVLNDILKYAGLSLDSLTASRGASAAPAATPTHGQHHPNIGTAFEIDGTTSYQKGDVEGGHASDGISVSSSNSRLSSKRFRETTPLLSGVTDDENKNILKYIVLDCHRLQGIDATGARNCFRALHNIADLNDIKIAYAGCDEDVVTLLRAHGAIHEPTSRTFANVYDALDWCETSLLNEVDDLGTSQGSELRARINTFDEDGFSNVLVRRHSLRETDSVTVPLIIGTMLDLDEDECESLADIQKYCAYMTLWAGEFMFHAGAESTDFYILLEGEIKLELQPNSPDGAMAVTFHKGAIIGYADHQLLQHRRFYARAVTNCIVAVIKGAAIEAMFAEQPHMLVRLLQVMLKQCCLELQNLNL